MGQKGWLVFDLKTEKTFVSRDVIFHEDKFPYLTPEPSEPVAAITAPHPTVFDEEHLEESTMTLQQNLLRGESTLHLTHPSISLRKRLWTTQNNKPATPLLKNLDEEEDKRQSPSYLSPTLRMLHRPKTLIITLIMLPPTSNRSLQVRFLIP